MGHSGTDLFCRAALTAFQKPEVSGLEEPDLSQSTVHSYTGIDKRDGLTAIGKRLVEGNATQNIVS
jgi:hypothetical protein